MPYRSPFLARLGLDEHAGAADIRRAYARELKLIDQERDAAGFQLLREAYEAAMQWGKGIAAPMPLASAMAPPPQVDRRALAGPVFAAFTANFVEMASSAVALDLTTCQSLLERALNDHALINMTARSHVEGCVVQLLAGGWQPGHDVLLIVASKAFGWRNDLRRLYEFGADGALLSQAIDERTMFEAQSGADLLAQGEVVAQLRTDVQLGHRALVRAMRHIDALEARFPKPA
jgi:hypothetical protein